MEQAMELGSVMQAAMQEHYKMAVAHDTSPDALRQLAMSGVRSAAARSAAKRGTSAEKAAAGGSDKQQVESQRKQQRLNAFLSLAAAAAIESAVHVALRGTSHGRLGRLRHLLQTGMPVSVANLGGWAACVHSCVCLYTHD